MTTPKFLQRIHFSPGAKHGDARPAIVQYHPQAVSERAKSQGYVLAFVEPWAVEHGPALAAGPAALDLLSRILDAIDHDLFKVNPSIAMVNGEPAAFLATRLLTEAHNLLTRATPPAGSVHPNGTPRTPAERGEEK